MLLRCCRSVFAVFLLAWIAPQLAAADRIFYAESVSYCSTSRAIDVETFLLELNVDQETVSFDINAASVEENLQAIISFELEAYDIEILNTSLNLCTELFGLLCPLPVYDFVATSTLPIPGGLPDDLNIPGIAFVIPDLQATALVKLNRVQDGSEAVCLRVELSNGKTLRLLGVEWALGGIALGALLVAGLSALVAGLFGDDARLNRGRRQERLLQIMTWYQFSAMTGLLSLEYPKCVVAWTNNFAWALGMIRISSFQDEIVDMRNRTGGNFSQAGGGIVGGTRAAGGRSLFTLPPVASAESTVAQVGNAMMANIQSAYRQSVVALEHGSQLGKRAAQDALGAANVAPADAYTTPIVQESDPLIIVEQGIPVWSLNLDISPYNAFSTVFFTFLLFLALFVAATLVFAVPLWFLSRRVERRAPEARSSRQVFTDIVRASALRMLLIAWFPIVLFSFYQWRVGQSDAWAPIVLSVFTFVPTTLALIIMWLLYARLVRRAAREPVLVNGGGPLMNGGGPYGPFWNPFRPTRWWAAAPLLLSNLAIAAFVAFAQNHGFVQAIALAAIEVIVFIALCVFTPFVNKQGNGLNITISIVRIIIAAALIALNRQTGLENEIGRTVVGFVIDVLEAVVTALLFIFLMIDVIVMIVYVFKTRKAHKRERQHGVLGKDAVGHEGEMLERPHDYGVYGHQPPLAPPGALGHGAGDRSSMTLAPTSSDEANESPMFGFGEPRGKSVDMSGRAGPAVV